MELKRPEKLKNKSEPAPELDRLAKEIIGAALEVHKVLGPGFLESVYEDALCVELKMRGLPFIRQPAVMVEYKGHDVGEGRLDLVVGGKVIVELKAVEALAPIHTAQLLSYLKMTNRQLGLLINFNAEMLRDGIKRVINS